MCVCVNHGGFPSERNASATILQSIKKEVVDGGGMFHLVMDLAVAEEVLVHLVEVSVRQRKCQREQVAAAAAAVVLLDVVQSLTKERWQSQREKQHLQQVSR